MSFTVASTVSSPDPAAPPYVTGTQLTVTLRFTNTSTAANDQLKCVSALVPASFRIDSVSGSTDPNQSWSRAPTNAEAAYPNRIFYRSDASNPLAHGNSATIVVKVTPLAPEATPWKVGVSTSQDIASCAKEASNNAINVPIDVHKAPQHPALSLTAAAERLLAAAPVTLTVSGGQGDGGITIETTENCAAAATDPPGTFTLTTTAESGDCRVTVTKAGTTTLEPATATLTLPIGTAHEGSGGGDLAPDPNVPQPGDGEGSSNDEGQETPGDKGQGPPQNGGNGGEPPSTPGDEREEPDDREAAPDSDRRIVTPRPTRDDPFRVDIRPGNPQRGPAPVGNGAPGSGAPRLERGGNLDVEVSGFAPSSQVHIRLLPADVPLGTVRVREDGSLSAAVGPIPAGVEACGAKVHVTGVLPDGEVIDVTIDTWIMASPYPFTDLANDRSHGMSVACLESRGVLVGTGGGRYSTGAPITRGQFATILARSFPAISTAGMAPAFSDIERNTHRDAIRSLTDTGVVRGYPDGSFRPNLHLTHTQLVSMLSSMTLIDAGTVSDVVASVTGVDPRAPIDAAPPLRREEVATIVLEIQAL